MRSPLFLFSLVGTLLAGTLCYACDPPDNPDDPVPCYACDTPCTCVDGPDWKCDCGHLEPQLLRDRIE